MKRQIVLGALVGVAAVASAQTGTWINTTANEQTQDWMLAANWQDGYIPVQEMDSADLSTIYTENGAQYFGFTRLPYANCTWNSLIDTSRRRVLCATYDGRLKYFPVYSVHDLSSFLGRFSFGYPFTLQFCGSTTLHNLSANYQPIVDVTNDAYTVVASNFYDRGWVKKTGPGVLRYDSWSGEKTGVKMAGGSLALRGAPDDLDDSRPAGTPWFWFDASETNGMTLVADGGVTNVTQWRAKSHQSGAQSLATPIDGVATPRLVRHGPNGWMVDFGARIDVKEFGGSQPDSEEKQAELQEQYGVSAGLALDNNAKIYDYFVVYEANDPTRTPVTLGSKENNGYFSPSLMRDNAYSPFFINSESSTALRTGEFRVDGNRMSYQDTYEVAGLHVVFATGGGARTSALGYAYRHGMCGGMKLAEVIAYGRELSPDERRATIRYLMKKWCRGYRNDRAQDWDLGAVALQQDTVISVGAGRTAKVRQIAGSVNKALTVSGGGTLAVEQLGAPPEGTSAKGKPAGASPIPVTVADGTLRLLKPLYTGDAAAPLPHDDGLVYHLDASDVESYDAVDGAVSVWRDTRAGSTRRAVYSGTDAAPTVKAGALNGLNMLSTGSFAGSATTGYFDLQDDGVNIAPDIAYCREAFLVFAQPSVTMDQTGWAMALGSSNNSYCDFEPQALGRMIGGRFLRSPSENSAAQPAGTFALNGTQFNPDIYDSISEPVVYSAHLHSPQRVSALAHRGANGTGGIDYGEVLLYKRELSPGERRNIEAYLLKKWFNKEHPSALPQRVGSTTVAATGAVALETGTALDVSGDLTVEAGGTLEFGVTAAETTPKISASGAMTIADGATVRITSGETAEPASGRLVLAKAKTLAADPAKLRVDVPATLFKGTLRVVGGELRWQAPRGLTVVVR